MALTVADLARPVNPLAAHYARFRVGDRLLLTGHSHQAWPDVAFEGQQQAWLDASELLDDKWDAAARIAAEVAAHWRTLLGDTTGSIALGPNTHELVTRLLSALPLDRRPRLVTTDGEFHTIRRQLARLGESGLDVAVVPARPVDTLAERLASVVDDRVAAVLVSSVLYDTAEIVPGLDVIAAACRRHGVALLVDAYHHVNAVPFDVDALGLGDAFVTGGGYKYCQLGEGNAFLRVPTGCTLRPVLTGWFAEFATRAASPGHGVSYGAGAEAFAGATYDPTAHYRAAAVQRFHREEGLTLDLLRAVSQHQVDTLLRGIEALDLPPGVLTIDAMSRDRRGGFLALRTGDAPGLVAALRTRGVHADARGTLVRLGPAPYLSDGQLRACIDALADALRTRDAHASDVAR